MEKLAWIEFKAEEVQIIKSAAQALKSAYVMLPPARQADLADELRYAESALDDAAAYVFDNIGKTALNNAYVPTVFTHLQISLPTLGRFLTADGSADLIFRYCAPTAQNLEWSRQVDEVFGSLVAHFKWVLSRAHPAVFYRLGR